MSSELKDALSCRIHEMDRSGAGDVITEKQQVNSRKHKLSITEQTATKKVNVAVRSKEEVKRDTELIFRILLKDDIKEWHRKDPPVVMMNAPKESKFELPTDIEGDGPFESKESDPIIDDIAERLGKMGDALNEDFKNDSTFQGTLITVSQAIAAEASCKVFNTAIESLLSDYTKQSPDASDYCQIALVVLCVRSALSQGSRALKPAYSISDSLISNAVNFVANHFPTCIGISGECSY